MEKLEGAKSVTTSLTLQLWQEAKQNGISWKDALEKGIKIRLEEIKTGYTLEEKLTKLSEKIAHLSENNTVLREKYTVIQDKRREEKAKVTVHQTPPIKEEELHKEPLKDNAGNDPKPEDNQSDTD